MTTKESDNASQDPHNCITANPTINQHMELLKELVFTPGVSGWEDAVRDKITQKISEYGKPEVDPLGNLTLTIGSGSKHLLIVAHMDEVGLVVSHIEEDGYIRVRKAGWVDDRLLLGRMVDLYPSPTSAPIPGVIGIKPPHLMKNREKEMEEMIRIENIAIDVGTRSRKETESLGIKKLTPVIMRKHFSVLNNHLVTTRGIDDRMGCAAVIETLKSTAKLKLDAKVTFAWSVQEELGLRGAYALGNKIHPDAAIIVDTCTTGDAPFVDFHLSAVKIDDGPAMRMFDRVAFASRNLMKAVESLAQKEGIPLQIALTGGTTDGAALQLFNVHMLALAVPVRYVHSPVEVMSINDYENLLRLLVEIVRNFTVMV
ncbi:MAG: M42 family metallopeptidase [bacterium]